MEGWHRSLSLSPSSSRSQQPRHTHTHSFISPLHGCHASKGSCVVGSSVGCLKVAVPLSSPPLPVHPIVVIHLHLHLDLHLPDPLRPAKESSQQQES